MAAAAATAADETKAEAKASPKVGPAGLTDAERKTLEKLIAKANIELGVHAPAVQVGREYVALTNLAVPQRGSKDLKTDLVLTGETVWLSDEEAAKFLRHGDRDGRRVAVIRLKSEVDMNKPPKAPPQLLTGPIFRPVTPPSGTDLPRPDPAGATRLVEQTTVPESQQPVVAQGGTPSIGDALDIVPGSGEAIRQATLAGADQDLMSAVRAQNPGLTAEDRRR